MRTMDQRVVGTLLAATVGLTSAAVLSSPVEAAQPNMIQGAVTNAEGSAGLGGITVTAMAERPVGGVTQWVEIATATTGSDGKFNVNKLPDGNYRVRYDDPSGNYATEYYDNAFVPADRSEEHTSELQSRRDLVCRLLLEKKKKKTIKTTTTK